MKDRVKQKDLFIYWKPGSQNIGDYFTKHHPPYLHREICATYLYMVNVLLKIDHKVVQEWENAVLTPNYMVVLRSNYKVVQGWANVVCMYRHTKTTTAT